MPAICLKRDYTTVRASASRVHLKGPERLLREPTRHLGAVSILMDRETIAGFDGSRKGEGAIRSFPYNVRLDQTELKRLQPRCIPEIIALGSYRDTGKINGLAYAARVDVAGVASSILATPSIFS